MRNPLDLFTGRIRRMQDGLRLTRATVTQPKPPVLIETGRTVPAWLLRSAYLGLGVLALIILGPSMVGTVIIAAVLLLLAFQPNAGTGAAYCAVLAVFWMVTPSAPISVDQFALLALGPAVWSLAGVLADLPLRTKIEWRALRPTAVRYLIIQVISQALLVGATVLQTGARHLDAVLVGMIAFGFTALLAAAAWMILPRLSRDQQR